jgi:hypothetical protein
MSKVNEILTGWKKYLFEESPLDDKIANKRAKICSECPEAKKGIYTAILPDYSFAEIQGYYCGICKCPLSTKVRSKDSNCPKNKW